MSRTVKFTPDPDRGRVLAERRRSSAAGPHGKRSKDRSNGRRQAIAASARGE
jgi:hypothetical protein